MLNTKGTLVWGLLALIAGIALGYYSDHITAAGILTCAGFLFIIAGVVNLLLTMFVKEDKAEYRERVREAKKKGDATEVIRRRKTRGLGYGLNIIASLCAVAFGVVLLVLTDNFVGLIPMVFAILVFFAAIMQFYTLAVGIRPVALPGWLYLFPILMIIGSIMIFTLKPDMTTADGQILADKMTMIYTGVCLALYGVCSILTGAMLINRHSKQKKEEAVEAAKPAETTATDKPATTDDKDKTPAAIKPLE